MDKHALSDQELSKLLRKWEQVEAPSNLESRVLGSLPRAPRWRSWAAAAAVAVAVVGFVFWPRKQPQVPQPPPLVAASEPAATPPAVKPPQARESVPPARVYTTYSFLGPGRANSISAKPEPQAPSDQPLPAGVYRVGNGVRVPGVLQRQEPEYSEEARIARLAGTVVLSLVVNEDGWARNVRVTRSLGLGLDEQATAAIAQWRFKPGVKDGISVAVAATIEVNFRTEAHSVWRLARAAFSSPEGALRPVLVRAPYPANSPPEENGAVALSFDVDSNGIPINFRAQSFPGNPKLESEAISIVSGWQFRAGTKDGKPVSVPCTLNFVHGEMPVDQSGAPTRIRVSPVAAANQLVDNPRPSYPSGAKAARVQGVVSLQVRIGKDGHVIEATVISGDPLLTPAAVEAVKQWLYRPTLLNGELVEVETQVEVNFTLTQ